MRRFILFAICVFMTVSGLVAQSTFSSCAYKSLIESEYAFASAAATTRIRSAFLQYLAEDAVVFRPGPKPGRKVYTESKESGAWRNWAPQYARVSRARDLGFTTGPWVYRDSATGPVGARGQYVSVWKKQYDDSWRLAADIGTSCETMTAVDSLAIPSLCDSSALSTDPGGKSETERAELLRLDTLFGIEGEIGKLVSPHAILCREGEAPVFGPLAMKERWGKGSAGIRTPLFSDVSNSGDLGYTYGESAHQRRGKCTYLHIWIREHLSDPWQLAVEVEGPIQK